MVLQGLENVLLLIIGGPIVFFFSISLEYLVDKTDMYNPKWNHLTFF
jgi:hypothetical protein